MPCQAGGKAGTMMTHSCTCSRPIWLPRRIFKRDWIKVVSCNQFILFNARKATSTYHQSEQVMGAYQRSDRKPFERRMAALSSRKGLRADTMLIQNEYPGKTDKNSCRRWLLGSHSISIHLHAIPGAWTGICSRRSQPASGCFWSGSQPLCPVCRNLSIASHHEM